MQYTCGTQGRGDKTATAYKTANTAIDKDNWI